MAVATTTALAIGGLAVSAASTGASFATAAKQRKQAAKLQRDAEAAAAKAMAEARKKLEINYYDKLAIQKEPYELAREAANVAAAQAIQAGQESERGSAATAGRVQMAQNEQQRNIATAMGQEMSNLEKLSATEDARLRDIGIQLDLGEVEGAQQALLQAQDMRNAATASTQQGIQGLGNLAQQGLQLVPLYGKTGDLPALPPSGGFQQGGSQQGGLNLQTPKFTGFQTNQTPQTFGFQSGQTPQTFGFYSQPLQYTPPSNYNINPFKF